MAFTFSGASTPAFGATSAPAFSFGGTPAPSPFGATATPLFGATPSPSTAASTPAFGASTPSLFGAPTGPQFGAVSTPAFSFAQSTPSFFGATSTPAFGASTPAFGATPFGAQQQSTPSLFGATPTPSLFGGMTSALALQQPQQQQQQSQIPQLVTKDNRPITHSTKWDDLSPQAQQYLLELDKIISSDRDDCVHLDNEDRLRLVETARHDLDESMKLLSQKVASLSTRVKADTDEADSIRTAVVHILRHAETAVYTFKKTHAWREATRSAPGQPLPSHIAEKIGGPIALPSQFLMDTIASLQERVKIHQASATALEAAVSRQNSTGGGGKSQKIAFSAGDPAAVLSSLQSAIMNVHDCLMKTAAELAGVDSRIETVKSNFMVARHRRGEIDDPFEEAEQQQRQESEKESMEWSLFKGKESDQSNGHAQQQQQQYGMNPQQQQGAVQQLSFPQPTGLFGTAPASSRRKR